MALQLFEHNEKAYIKVKVMLNDTGKAAVIHPTGTGKSYIAFKLIEDNPDAKIIWLSPSEYIFKTQKESLEKNSEAHILQNVQFFTYAKLMMSSNQQIERLYADYIIIDEFHRCGAERWGEGVEVLISSNPQAKLLGLSATNIRYLDNQRDIAQEMFDGHIASKMTLAECIVRGILPAPKYVTTVFRYQQELDMFKKQILNIKNSAVRDINQQYYDALRRALKHADGLDVILKKYITNKSGKYIVFCSGYEHLKEMRNLTARWFEAVNPEVNTYIAYSNNPATSRAFQNFKQNNNDALKLLFCIDMLNEGVHIKGISGVILFRPTISPIIYMQQIGRALTSGDSETPLILDVVNNFEGLCNISAIQQEMNEIVYFMRMNGEENNIVVERFEVEEQIKDCTRLFEQLNSSLTTPWNHYYEQAVNYYNENGHLKVPKNYVTHQGLNLGQWLCTQRVLYRNSRYKLSEEQIEKLEKIGINWLKNDDLLWEQNYAAATEYYVNNGHLRVPVKYVTDTGLTLGKWISNQRTKYRNKSETLTEEQIYLLNSIGMIWDENEAQWMEHYNAAAKFFDENGHLDVPINYRTSDGFALGNWLSAIRCARRGGSKRKLTDRQIKDLDDIGMVWEKRNDLIWQKGYEIAREYYHKYGNVEVSSSYKTQDGFALGKWILRQRYAYNNPEKSNSVLTEERVEKLKNIGILPVKKV